MILKDSRIYKCSNRVSLVLYQQIYMEFEWNEQKAKSNLSKHGVSFAEAKTVFEDPLYVDFYDPDHSYNEHRYII